MRKILIVLAVLLFTTSIAFSDTSIYKRIFAIGGNTGDYRYFVVGDDGELHCSSVTVTGDLFVKGSFVSSGTFVVTGDITVSSLTVKTELYTSLAAKSTFYVTGADGINISTNTIDSTTTPLPDTTSYAFGAEFTQNPIARNYSFRWITLNALRTNITITGYDASGSVQTEVVEVTTGATAVSNYAWARGTTFLIGSVLGPCTETAATVQLNIGNGDKIGLLGDIPGGGTSICFRGFVDGSDELSSFTFNSTYDTWTHSDVPDSSDNYDISYRVGSE